MNDDSITATLGRLDDDTQTRAMERIEQILQAKAVFMRDAFNALDFNGISGDYAEFGCYGGVTMRLAFGHQTIAGPARHMWAFDSFEGLPAQTHERDDHPQWRPQSMKMDLDSFRETLRSGGVPDDGYTAVPGFFDASLPALGSTGAPADIALAYVDCDLYSSTVSVLEFLAPRLKHGMIVAFDDYNCWSPTAISGERAALLEFEAAHPQWHFQRFRDIGWEGTSFVVESTSLLR